MSAFHPLRTLGLLSTHCGHSSANFGAPLPGVFQPPSHLRQEEEAEGVSDQVIGEMREPRARYESILEIGQADDESERGRNSHCQGEPLPFSACRFFGRFSVAGGHFLTLAALRSAFHPLLSLSLPARSW